MARIWKDRVLDTTTTTGTGTLTLAGAATGYQAASAVGDGNGAYWVVYAVDSNGNPTGDWEVFDGTYTASGTTLTRASVLASSNGGSAVSLAAGTKRVALVNPAARSLVSDGVPAAGSLLFATTDGVTSALAVGANTFPARASTGAMAAKSITDFGLSLVDDPDNTTARTTLGLGTAAVENTGTSGNTVPLLSGANTFSAAQTVTVTDAVTNTTTTLLTLDHESSGTPASPFGGTLDLKLKSSTTAGQNAARLRWVWFDATHATRKGYLYLEAADDTATWRTGVTVGTSGTAPTLGFLTATAAIRQTGDVGTAAVTFGLMSGTPTFGVANLTGLNSLTLADVHFSPDQNDGLFGYDVGGAAVRRYTFDRVLGMALDFQARLTTESGVPVSTSDRTAQSTLYLTPFNGNRVALWDGTRWAAVALSEVAVALSGLTASRPYDVYVFASTATPSSTNTGTDIVTFGSATGWATGSMVVAASTVGGLTAGTVYFYNAASSTTGSFHATLANALAGSSKVDLTASVTQALTAVSLELLAWTSDSARATAIVLQDGVWAKTGDLTRRLAGTIRTTGTTTTEDSAAKRFVGNVYNDVPRRLFNAPGYADDNATTNITHTATTTAEVNAGTNSRVEVVFPLPNVLSVLAAYNVASTPAANAGRCAIGIDTVANMEVVAALPGGGATYPAIALPHAKSLAPGYHYAALVAAVGGGTMTISVDLGRAGGSSVDMYSTFINGTVTL